MKWKQNFPFFPADRIKLYRGGRWFSDTSLNVPLGSNPGLWLGHREIHCAATKTVPLITVWESSWCFFANTRQLPCFCLLCHKDQIGGVLPWQLLSSHRIYGPACLFLPFKNYRGHCAPASLEHSTSSVAFSWSDLNTVLLLRQLLPLPPFCSNMFCQLWDFI